MSELKATTNSPLVLPGPVTAGVNYLCLADNIDPEQAHSAFSMLKNMNASRQWFCGDYILEINRLKEIRHKDDPIQRMNTTHLAKEMDYQPNTVSRAVMVCKAFSPQQRVFGMSFAHHMTALDEAGYDKPAQAKLWILKAQKNQWSVATMREHMRANRKPTGMKSQHSNGIGIFYKALAAVRKIKAMGISQQQRETLKKDLEPLKEWLRRL